MAGLHAEQNLRLAQKMLEQQGEINRLKAELSKAQAKADRLTAQALEYGLPWPGMEE